MLHFLNMGGYACYVWPAYGLTAVLMGWTLLRAWRAQRKCLRTQQRKAQTPQ